MFDIATRPQPALSAAAVFGLPFDWRMVQPQPVTSYPWKDFVQPTGVPVVYADQLATYALDIEETLQTAIIHSLFSNRRAGPDDRLPMNVTDRGGWVGDEFGGGGFDARLDAYGSRLWLYYGGKTTRDVLEGARYAAQEALGWLVRDGIASRVAVTTQWLGERSDRLAVRPSIYQPDQQRPVYDVLWGTSIRKLA